MLVTTFDDPRLRTVDDRSYAALKYAHNFPDVVDVTAQVYYDSYDHKIGFPYSVLLGNTLTAFPFSGSETWANGGARNCNSTKPCGTSTCSRWGANTGTISTKSNVSPARRRSA